MMEKLNMNMYTDDWTWVWEYISVSDPIAANTKFCSNKFWYHLTN